MNNARWIDKMMYRLKRLYGRAVTVSLSTEHERDFKENKVTKTTESWLVRKALILDREASRDFVYDLNYIAANKNFTMGAYFDTYDRRVIIHRTDLPKGLKPSIGMYMTIGDRHYEVQKYQDFDPYGHVLIFSIKGIAGNRADG